MVNLLPGSEWVIGKPFLLSVFTTVDIDNKLIEFSFVTIKDTSKPGSFESFFGWGVLISICVACLVIYIIAVAVYHILKKKIDKNLNIKTLEEKYKRVLGC